MLDCIRLHINKSQKNKYNFSQLSKYALDHDLDPQPLSGQQELLENHFNRYLK